VGLEGKYVLIAGKLFSALICLEIFGKGNCSEVSLKQAATQLEHYRKVGGAPIADGNA